MAAWQRGDDGVLELEGLTPTQSTWMGSGCLVLGLAFCLGLAALGEAADGRPLAQPLGLGTLVLLLLGGTVLGLGLNLHEVYLVKAGGVYRRRTWLGRTREEVLAGTQAIHSLALDGSDRLPRRWRLMLVRRDGTTFQLVGYQEQEAQEEVRWSAIVSVGEEVAGALAVPLRLPQGVERERRLEVLPGDPLTVHYPEFTQETTKELEGLCLLSVMLAAGCALALWLHSRGVI